jgi:L-ascorbate metabolism protein UlaG (beta-lactamase superfamily)
MANVPLTWLGHGSFRLDSPSGKRIYLDPFLNGNPKCPESERHPERMDIMAITHGHSDHTGDAVDFAKRFEPHVVAPVELKAWLGSKGAPVGDLPGINKGGTQEIDGIRFTLTNAFHSSSTDDGAYTGEACGIVIRFDHGPCVYFAGDTCVFSDMQLIGRIYRPDLAVIPIGGWFVMDPTEAAVAIELIGAPRYLPCHYGTFPILAGTPEELRELAPEASIVDIQPGQTIEL